LLALVAVTERRTPAEIARTYDVICGKLVKKAPAIYADFLALGGKLKWLSDGEDGIAAEAELTYKDQTIKYRYTLEMAKRAGVVKADSGWVKRPGNMLRSKVYSNAIPMLEPSIVAGYQDDDDQPAIPTAPVFASAPTAEAPAPEPKKKEKKKPADVVVEAEVVAAPVETLTPAATTEPEPAPAETPKPAQVDSIDGKITVATINTLVDALGNDNIPKVLEWLKAKGWITSSIADLRPSRAQEILTKLDSFKKAVGIA
jgi:hypothetical protein